MLCFNWDVICVRMSVCMCQRLAKPYGCELFSISSVVTSCALAFPRAAQPGYMLPRKYTKLMHTIQPSPTDSLFLLFSLFPFFADINHRPLRLCV